MVVPRVSDTAVSVQLQEVVSSATDVTVSAVLVAVALVVVATDTEYAAEV